MVCVPMSCLKLMKSGVPKGVAGRTTLGCGSRGVLLGRWQGAGTAGHVEGRNDVGRGLRSSSLSLVAQAKMKSVAQTWLRGSSFDIILAPPMSNKFHAFSASLLFGACGHGGGPFLGYGATCFSASISGAEVETAWPW